MPKRTGFDKPMHFWMVKNEEALFIVRIIETGELVEANFYQSRTYPNQFNSDWQYVGKGILHQKLV